MKTLFIVSAGVLACLATACDWENSHSDRISVKSIHNSCSKTNLVFEGDKIITATLSFGSHVAQVKNFFYVHGLLTSVKMTSDDGLSFETQLEYDADRRLSKEIYSQKYSGIDASGNQIAFSFVNLTEFVYDENGNILTTLTTQSKSSDRDDNQSNGGRSARDELEEEKRVDRHDYTWSKGNVIKETRRYCDEHGSCGVPFDETFYTYDNKRNYTNQEIVFRYINLSSIPFVFSRNNVTKIASDFNGELKQDYWYEFHYNKHGYPSDYNCMYDGATPNPFTLEYR